MSTPADTMMVAQPEAMSVRTANLPAVYQENGRTVMIIDARRYHELSATQKKEYRAAFEHELERNGFGEATRKKILDDYRDLFDRDRLAMGTRNRFYGEKPGQKNFNIIRLDDDVPTPPYSAAFAFLPHESLPPGANEFYNHFSLRREMAMALSGDDFKESAADFIAAVETLVDHPDARKSLELVSDGRLARGLTGNRSTVDDVKNTMSGQAIRAALSLSDERLAELRGMMPQDRKIMLLSEAAQQDIRADYYTRQGVTGRVFSALQQRGVEMRFNEVQEELRQMEETLTTAGVNPVSDNIAQAYRHKLNSWDELERESLFQRGVPGGASGVLAMGGITGPAKVAHNLLTQNPVFDPGTEENLLLTQYRDALERLLHVASPFEMPPGLRGNDGVAPTLLDPNGNSPVIPVLRMGAPGGFRP